MVFCRSPVIRANSRCDRSRSLRISLSLIDTGMVFPFLFFMLLLRYNKFVSVKGLNVSLKPHTMNLY